MFSNFKLQFILIVYALIILSIPAAAYLISKRQNAQNTRPKSVTVIDTSPSLSEDQLQTTNEETNPPPKTNSDLDETKVTLPVSFGPTLNLKIVLEGRPKSNQSSKLFIGIAEGDPTSNPKYLLSFTVDLPASGIFEGLSLAGLNSGSRYTAYIKGPAQIATASAFIMAASVTSLNSSEPVTLLTGDFNEDNVINTADFSLAKSALGANENSKNWNSNMDLNKDGTINSVDLSYIIKNFGKTGTSGIWISTPISTSSGTPNLHIEASSTPSGSPEGQSGYWLWIPK